MDNLKVKKYILFGGFSEDLSLEDSFKLSEGLLQRGKRNEDSWELMKHKPGSQTIKRLLLKKARNLKLMHLVLFCIGEDAIVWAH